MKSHRTTNGNLGATMVTVLLLILVQENSVNAAKAYRCLGGCFNKCFPSPEGTEPQGVDCYYQCLNSCVISTVADFQYYCQIGCSLESCIPVSYDGALLESCFGRCTDVCKIG